MRTTKDTAPTVLLLAGLSLQAQQPSTVDKAFDAFWKADDVKAAGMAAERLVETGIDFDTAYAVLKAGGRYGKEKTGESVGTLRSRQTP